MNRDLTYLLDIAHACQTVLDFIDGIDRETFKADRRTHLAVLYEITVIGEVAKRLSTDFRQNHPSIPWRAIAGMRDKLIHEYNKVDLNLAWEVTQSDIPNLMEFSLKMISAEASEFDAKC
jgi:uncharacterized protein with HEPN domain